MTIRARVVVDSRIRIYKPDVSTTVLCEVAALFDHPNPQHEKLLRMGIRRFDRTKEPRTIRTWRDEGNWLTVPRGGMRRVRELLSQHGIEIALKDARTDGHPDVVKGFRWPEHRVTLFDDQERAVEAILARQTCCLRAPTGSGKTTVGVACIPRVKLPTIVVVWTGALLDQWVERVVKELGMRERDIGIVGRSKKRVGPITIALQQSIARMSATDPFFRFFGLVIGDELQRFASPSFVASIDPFVARYRIGISANERRKDRKEFLIYDEFGDVALSIDRKELVAKGRVRDVEIRVVPTGWESEVDLTTLNAIEAHKAMLDEMETADTRDERVLEIVRQELEAGESVLVFSLRVAHCRRLVGMLGSAGISAGLMLGGVENREALGAAVRGMREGRVRVGVGTIQAIGTGVDLPKVGAGIVAMPIASDRYLLEQVAGRVCRLSESQGAARLYYLLDLQLAKRHFDKLFLDGRPMWVLSPEGWVDGRKDRKRAKRIAVPDDDAAWLGFGGAGR
jgi:superfamily II DNA or RNA helicase